MFSARTIIEEYEKFDPETAANVKRSVMGASPFPEALYLDADAPPGRYQVAVGWYLLETMQRLPVLDTEGRAVDDKVLLPGPTVSGSTPQSMP